MSAPPPVPGRNSYDLYLSFGQKRFVWSNPDHGVTLTDSAIARIARGREWRARLRDVAEVHLGTGNVGESTIATCRLSFADGSTVLIASSNSHGLQEDARDRLYATFVDDLHRRLAALKDGRTAFTAGVSEARYRFGNFGVVSFLDGGQVYETSTPKFADFRYGAGIGARYYTNFGPIRIDVATPISRRPGENALGVYISIGQAF